MRLFERSTRVVQLTAAGKALLGDVRDLLSRVDAMVQRAQLADRTRSGPLRVGYSPTPTAELLPLVLESFRTAEPHGRVVLLDLDSEEMIAGVEQEKLDVALMVRPFGTEWKRLKFQALFDVPVGAILPACHRFAGRPSLSLDEALSEPIVAFVRKGYRDYHCWLNEALRRATRKPDVRMTADGSASLIAAVVSGQGIALGPRSYETSFGPRVRYVPLSTPLPALQLGILRRQTRPNPLVSSFVRAAEESARNLRH